MAHGPGLVAAPSVDLVGVWGRSLERADALAQHLGVTAYDDYAALRRYLVDEGFLTREGGIYWRSGGTVEV